MGKRVSDFRAGAEMGELQVLRLRDRAQQYTAQWYALDNAARAIREEMVKRLDMIAEETGK